MNDDLAQSKQRNEQIVIVSGLPRSGTSMLMQMLVAGGLEALTDDTRVADDDNPEGYFELERIKNLRRDSSWFDEARGKVIKVVAPLLGFLPLGYDCRVVFVLRDVAEVVRSQQIMLERLEQKGASMGAEMLEKQFTMLLDRTRAQLQEKFPDNVLYVEHRECITAPATVAAGLQNFLGAGLDTASMAARVNPGLYRNRATRVRH
jgi:hypothetical protein